MRLWIVMIAAEIINITAMSIAMIFVAVRRSVVAFSMCFMF